MTDEQRAHYIMSNYDPRTERMTMEAAIVQALCDARAWQREQDAKIAEGPLFNSFSGKKIAARIRATAFDETSGKKETT